MTASPPYDGVAFLRAATLGWLVRSSYAVRSNPQTVSNTFAAWSLPVIHPFAQPNFKAITPCDH